MTLSATGQIDFWFDPAVDVTTHDALTGVTAGNGATGTAIVCSTGLPFFSAQTTVYQQFAPNAVDLGGQGISFLPTGPTTWAVIDGGCGPWQSYSAAFLFDRSDEMQALQTNSSLTRAANSVTAATADIAEYFAEHPTGKVLLYEFLGVTVNRIGGAASVYTNAASATSALSLLSPLASGKPLADALCTAKDGLVAFDPAAHAYQRKFYLYCCGGDDGSTVASCRGTAPEATDGNRCSQTAADAQHPTAFSSGSWQDAVCGLIYNQVEVHAYYWDDFAVRVGQVDLVGALCDATGGTIYRVWDAGTGPVVDPWRVSGLACKDFLGTRLSMTHDGIPQIGQTVRIGCRTDNALPYLLGVGFQNTSIGSFALPLSLASFGAPGCTLYSSWDVTDSFLLWHDTKTLHIPQASWLIGLSLYYQGLQPHVLNNQLGAVTSNLLRMTIAP
jgi:hypothetical protein